MNAVNMIRQGLPVLFILLFVCTGEGQVIQATIKKGGPNKVDLFIKPDFSNTDPANYLFQLQFPVTWPSFISPPPTGLSITIDPVFAAFFGTYTATVYPLATHAGTSEVYFAVSLIRSNSNPTTSWVAGTEYRVFTAEFLNTVPPAMSFVKVADFLDHGSDGQGNYYTQDVQSNYYRDNANSINNFYMDPPLSTIGGTADDGYALTLDEIVLPGEDLSFSGYKDGSKNQLKWTTSTELNNKGFEVQRSADGISYTTIGFVNSAANGGNSVSPLNYTFTDNQVTGSRQYYRLRQVYRDNHSKLSRVVVIDQDLPVTITLDGLFPNPATAIINLRLTSPLADRLNVQLINAAGSLVMQRALAVEKGNNTLQLDISSLPAGMYLIKLVCSNGCEKAVSRFVKQ